MQNKNGKRRAFAALFFSIALIIIVAGCSSAATSTPVTNIQITGIVNTPSSNANNPIQTFASAPQLSGKIVYAAGADNKSNIFVLDLGDGKSKQLTDDNNSIEPAWSPDGKQIAYACSKSGARQVCVMDQDGGNKRALTSSAGTKWSVDWSPDGKSLAFVSNEVPYAHIFILNLADNKIRRLLPANSPGNESAPRWSPDNQWIAYTSDRKGFNIFKAKTDGSQEQQLTFGNTDDRLCWSSDGKSFIFRRIAKESSFFNGNEIQKMDADGKTVTQLTDNIMGDDWPSFSPDGKWIVYSTETKDGVYQLAVLPAAGGQAAYLTKEPILGIAARWKP